LHTIKSHANVQISAGQQTRVEKPSRRTRWDRPSYL